MSAPLPEGVLHLLAADDLIGRSYGIQGLLPSCYGEEGSEFDRDSRYCPECVREAARWNAESG